MSVLVILLPPRPRASGDATAAAEYAYVLSHDGSSVQSQGRASAARLPRAASVCAVLPDADLGWQRLAVPKAPAARLRAALGGLLEEQLLADDDAVHLALQPGATAGQPAWVAVTDRAWLAARLAELEAAGLGPERVLPASWPVLDKNADKHADKRVDPSLSADSPPDTRAGTPGEAHAHLLAPPEDGGEPTLVWRDAEGVALMRLGGSLARHQLQGADRSALSCSAHPAAVAAAERWFEGPVAVLGDAERALAALASPWNLRQFDLAPRHRGLVALKLGLRQLAGPEWRPLRWGLAALLLVQLAGLNLWAWRLEQAAQDKRQAMLRLLQASHPQVRSVLDAPLQMQRETELLRSAAGRPGPGDLEPMLAAAAAAWPEGQPPLQALRFEPGRLSITAAGWAEAQHASFDERLRAAGYQAERQGPQLILSPRGRT